VDESNALYQRECLRNLGGECCKFKVMIFSVVSEYKLRKLCIESHLLVVADLDVKAESTKRELDIHDSSRKGTIALVSNRGFVITLCTDRCTGKCPVER
jgi:hypothetical protein